MQIIEREVEPNIVQIGGRADYLESSCADLSRNLCKAI